MPNLSILNKLLSLSVPKKYTEQTAGIIKIMNKQNVFILLELLH